MWMMLLHLNVNKKSDNDYDDLLTFFKMNISKNSFRNTIRVSISLDPDQDRGYNTYQEA